MTCRACWWEFCWMCMGKWSDHGSGSGGFYKCNKYEEAIKTKGYFESEESKWDQIWNDLEKFVFYSERFENQKIDIEKIQGDLKTKIQE